MAYAKNLSLKPFDIDGLSWPSKYLLLIILLYISFLIYSFFFLNTGIGTKQRLNETTEQKYERTNKLAEAVKTILECIGEDPEREGLQKTPHRYAQALMFFSKGYEESIERMFLLNYFFIPFFVFF